MSYLQTQIKISPTVKTALVVWTVGIVIAGSSLVAATAIIKKSKKITPLSSSLVTLTTNTGASSQSLTCTTTSCGSISLLAKRTGLDGASSVILSIEENHDVTISSASVWTKATAVPSSVCSGTAACSKLAAGIVIIKPGTYNYRSCVSYSSTKSCSSTVTVTAKTIPLRERLIKLLKDDWKVTDGNTITELADFIDAEPERDNVYNTLLTMLAKKTGVVEYAGSDPMLLAQNYVIVYDAVYATNYLAEPYRGYFKTLILPNLEKGVIGVRMTKTLGSAVVARYNSSGDYLEERTSSTIYINDFTDRAAMLHEFTHAWQDGSGKQTYGPTMSDFEMEAHLIDTEYAMRVKEYIVPNGNGTYQVVDISETYDIRKIPPAAKVEGVYYWLKFIVMFQRALDNVNAGRNDLNKMRVMVPPNTVSSETKNWSKIMISKMSDTKAKAYLASKIPLLRGGFKNGYAERRRDMTISRGGIIGLLAKIFSSTADFVDWTYGFDGFTVRQPKQ